MNLKRRCTRKCLQDEPIKENSMSDPFVAFSILCTDKNMSGLKETLKQINYSMSECSRPADIIHLVMWRGSVWSYARKYDPCEQYTRCNVDDVRTYLLENSLEN